MKKATFAAIALTIFAGAASAATDVDFANHGVDRDSLTPAQELTISNILSSDLSFNEKRAVVNATVNNG